MISSDMSRRTFLRTGSAVGGGLVISVAIGCSPAENKSLTPEVNVTSAELNAFVEISSDNQVTLYAPVPEIGQGVRTALPMILAEELDIDWRDVRIKQAPGGDEYGPRQIAAGSASVLVYWKPLREAGATARAMLLAVAAKRWEVNAGACSTELGMAIHPNGREKLPYGKLADEASAMPVPQNVKLKEAADFKIVGSSVENVDALSIVTGEPLFGLDVERPNMVRAVIARCPTYGGRVKNFDDRETLKIPGVIQTVRIERVGSSAERPYVDEGIAVVATSTWAALQGRGALRVEWDEGPNIQESTDRLHQLCQGYLQEPAEIVRDDGDAIGELSSGNTTLDVTYHVPFIAHACMEPMNCTTELTPDKCEQWSPTQSPGNDRNAVAGEVDLPVEAVTVNAMRCGGGFGRRVGPEDYTYESVQLAKAVGRPVQVVWSREDDIQHDSYRAFSYHRLIAKLDGSGNISAWLHRQSGTSRYAFRQNRAPGISEFFDYNFPGGLIENYRLEYALAQSNLPRSILRAPGNNALSFVVESFIDELANAANEDPYKFRLDLLGDDRDFDIDEEGSVLSTKRMKSVLRTVAENSGWGEPLPLGKGRGIASHFTFGTYVAYVVEVSVSEETGQYTVDRVVGAIDCGRAINPLGIKSQVEGGINDAIHATRHGEITFKNGAVEQSNFHDYPLARMNEAATNIDVHIIEGSDEITGVGEPPYPPMIPALANALFAATGKRVRRLPIRPEEFQKV